MSGGAKEFLVRASYLEIYNEEIRDLLSKNPEARLELKEHPDRGVYVKDLMQFVVKSVAEIGSVLQVRQLAGTLQQASAGAHRPQGCHVAPNQQPPLQTAIKAFNLTNLQATAEKLAAEENSSNIQYCWSLACGPAAWVDYAAGRWARRTVWLVLP
jgi:CHASE3 domain sensor protein